MYPHRQTERHIDKSLTVQVLCGTGEIQTTTTTTNLPSIYIYDDDEAVLWDTVELCRTTTR